MKLEFWLIYRFTYNLQNNYFNTTLNKNVRYLKKKKKLDRPVNLDYLITIKLTGRSNNILGFL
jgi:hypothetical protein